MDDYEATSACLLWKYSTLHVPTLPENYISSISGFPHGNANEALENMINLRLYNNFMLQNWWQYR